MVVVLGSIHHHLISKSAIIISANISSSSYVNNSQRLFLTRRNSSILATSSILSSFLHLASFQLANARVEEETPQRQEERVVQVFEEASPSVVFIKDFELAETSSGRSTNTEEVLTKEEEETAKVEGTGSGFIWDKSGHIVTNYHVIAKLATDTTGLQLCKVFLEDAHGEKFSKEGKLVGFDPTYDLAVLKIDVAEGNFDLKPALLRHKSPEVPRRAGTKVQYPSLICFKRFPTYHKIPVLGNPHFSKSKKQMEF
ncbi:protease Do-like 5, chloroplastic [Papaver somniferum]|uniref:protease Do-like 5, chloroplastic n=1 Tax=Papaver somniferum TaxID=3469 RepID=UPI000E6F6357|nr:protease Do-like 5, chloroplastic [Papaver somniferum]XP_026437216.1 protease Do-like 5, chloroplastic [Papaver somniferum]